MYFQLEPARYCAGPAPDAMAGEPAPADVGAGFAAQHQGSMPVLAASLTVFMPHASAGTLRRSFSPRRNPLFATVEPPSPPRTVKPAQRPVWASPSKKNIQNEGAQYASDLAAFERRAATYRAHAHERCHHHRPALAGDLQWPYNGASLRHSCARSAGAGAEGGEALVFDPITSEVRALPAGGARAAALQRPSSAPLVRPASRGAGSYSAAAAARLEYQQQRAQPTDDRPHTATGTARAGAAARGGPASPLGSPASPGGRGRGWAGGAQGRYDPLCHKWLAAPAVDAAAQRYKQREGDRILGRIGIKCGPHQGPAAAAAAAREDGAAGNGDAAADAAGEPADDASPRKQDARCASPGAALGSPAGARVGLPVSAELALSPTRNPITGEGCPEPRAKFASGRHGVHSGESWGTYDIFRHEFKVPPSDPRFLQQEELAVKTAFISGKGIRRVPLPASQGVYDPIRGAWVVPPSDGRAVKGLDFAPRDVFEKEGPAAAAAAAAAPGARARSPPPFGVDAFENEARGVRGTLMFARRGSPRGGGLL